MSELVWPLHRFTAGLSFPSEICGVNPLSYIVIAASIWHDGWQAHQG